MLELSRINNFVDVISLIRSLRRNGTRTYSYRQLAEKFGYNSPRTLAMVHKGQRPPSQALVRKIIYHFELTSHEAELLILLAEKSALEKKNIPTHALDEKILMLKKNMARIKLYNDTNSREGDEASTNFCTTLFLNMNDIKKLNQILRSFLFELNENYPLSESGKKLYQIVIRLQPHDPR